ncbi:MAG: glucosaminidase domain-containing protein [Sediminibacterium sp.]|nr:glucosaminidase domain-containing protein [Sediminibacterium sp.]MBP6144723.1 glucosaminidase domain-containing protein [Sediminibacterium sp.]
MKQKILIPFFILLTTVTGWAQNNKTTLSYIEQYKAIAMKEMKRTGVPASITLAQAIVESNSGESNLAKNHNNHFGIKCKSDWTGAKAYQDDDTKQECFRAYDAAEQSFKDHSNFLKNRPNYVSLFLLDPVDDTAWAYGLKKAGYATATDYPKKLLKIIDDYELAQYNFPELANEIEEEEASTKVLADAPVNKTASDAPLNKTLADAPVNKTASDTPLNKTASDTVISQPLVDSVKALSTDTIAKAVVLESKSLNKPSGIAQTNANSYTTPLPIKQLAPASIAIADTVKSVKKEIPAPEEKPIESFAPVYNYPEGRFRINQVPVLLGKKDMSFVEIAIQFNLPLYKLFEYNEIKEAILLDRDQLIFLAPKKKEGATSFHTVKYNTTLHEISQLEGVQLSQLKLYNPKLNEEVKEGTQVLLFKSKEISPSIKKDNSLLFNKKLK